MPPVLQMDRSSGPRAEERLHLGPRRCAHLLARLRRYPEFIAPLLTRGQGCHVWEADDNEYIEYDGPAVGELGYGFHRSSSGVLGNCRLGQLQPTNRLSWLGRGFPGSRSGCSMVKFAKKGPTSPRQQSASPAP